MDVLKALKQIPDESVDMQICSPPYWGLRDYGEGTQSTWDGDKNCEHEFEEYEQKQHSGRGEQDQGYMQYIKGKDVPDKIVTLGSCSKCGAWKGQLGLEPDFNLFIKHLCDIFDEVKRVLKKDGTCWVNLGDTYYTKSGSGFVNDNLNPKTEEEVSSTTGINVANEIRGRGLLPSKCLTCVPERFVLEMINRGWILRNKIIWHKPNHMPTSVKDRFANSWEYLFMFSNSKKYYFDLDAIREPHKGISIKRLFSEDHLDKRKIDTTGMLSMSPKSQIKSNIKRKQEYLDGEMKGKNPDDVIEAKNWRQGMARDETEMIEVRPNLPTQKEFVDSLRETFSVDKLVEKGLKRTTVEHWFRYDDYGFSYPSKEEWIKVDTTLFPELLQIELKPNTVINNLSGKNPSDFWNITTRGYKESHFAVFPEALVKRPIKTTPQWICNKCGKARERIVEREGLSSSELMKNKDKSAWKSEQGQKQNMRAPREAFERRLINKGWTNCNCNTGFHSAVIMDIFAGSGTTLKVARDLKRDSIGIEIKKEYCDLIYKRLFAGSYSLFPDEFKLIK